MNKQTFELSGSVRKRLDATGEQMAESTSVAYRTYQRRAKKGMLEGAESAKVEMLGSLLDLGSRVLGSEEDEPGCGSLHPSSHSVASAPSTCSTP